MIDNRIDISLLGPVQIISNGKVVNGFESRKAEALFCYLVASQQPVSRSSIVEMFWGDKPEKNGRSNLSRVLHNNSALLPDTLVYSRQNVEFVRAPGVFTDVSFFHELVARNDIGSLVEAANLFRGDFLDGMDVNGCPDFDTWLTTERGIWHQRIVNVLATLVAQYRTIGEYTEGLEYAQRLLQLDPWHEETYREMMLMYALHGERSAALIQYDKCSRVLNDDLGVTPSAETTALYYRIRSGEVRQKGRNPSSVVKELAAIKHLTTVSQYERGVSHRLSATKHRSSQELEHKRLQSKSDRVPGSLSDIEYLNTATLRSDQESELEQIIERISDPRCRLLTLVGQNREIRQQLLYQTVSSLKLAFFDGVCWIASSKTNSSSLLVDIADSLKFSLDESEWNLLEDRVDTAMTWMFKHLRSKELLLVLQDAEQYSDQSELLEAIIQRSPQTKIVASARSPINLVDEWLFDV